MLQLQVPLFNNDHVFTKVLPGSMIVPSGIVTSLTYEELSHPTAPPEEVGLPNRKPPDCVGNEANVAEAVGRGVSVGGVNANCVACWAERV